MTPCEEYDSIPDLLTWIHEKNKDMSEIIVFEVDNLPVKYCHL